VRRGAFDLLLLVAAAVGLAFLTLPLIALFLRVPLVTLVSQLASEGAREALLVSLKTSLLAHVLVLGFGTPLAYLLAMRDFPGRRTVIALVELPLVRS